MDNDIIAELEKHSDYQILRRLPTTLAPRESSSPKAFIASIIDLETMGLEPNSDSIIELGLLSFSFDSSNGVIKVVDEYNELNDPGMSIPAEITKITGITNDCVKGRAIDWQYVHELLNKTDLIICHNSRFDRNFLELQTPPSIQNLIKSMAFACSIKDILWNERGYESAKLDYLNWKMGYFYEGHRALVDCWATLNLFLREEGAFIELLGNVRKKETLICAKNAPFEKKDLLKARKYRWSDGGGKLPKSWWACIPNVDIEEEKRWLDEIIYAKQGASNAIPQQEINARKRYSYRAEEIT